MPTAIDGNLTASQTREGGSSIRHLEEVISVEIYNSSAGTQ